MRIPTLIAALASMAFAVSSHAASDTSCDLSGAITTESGASLSHAFVRLTDTRTGQVRERRTNAFGRYHFNGVRPDGDGHQQLDVAATGYPTRTFVKLACPLGLSMKADVALQPAL